MASVKIPVEATFDSSQMETQLAQVTAKLNQLGQTAAKMQGESWSPISKTTLSDLMKVQDAFEKMKRSAPNLAASLGKSGQSKTDFLDVNWEKVFSNAFIRSAQTAGVFRKIMTGVGDGGFVRTPPAGVGGGQYGREIDPHNNNRSGAGSGGGNRGTGGGNSPGTTWGSAGRKILGSGLRSMGGAGSAAAGAMDGMAGGIAGPMILANLVAQGISAVAGMVKAKIGDAQQLDIGTDTLKRQLGDVGVGFQTLKSSLENASWGFSATYQETQKVAEAFSKAAGTFGKAGAEHLASEVEISGGFARSFGIDPARSGQFFGMMRSSGITSDANGSKRLALEIGEAVAKSGSSAKLDEVMESVAGFVQQQSRYSMTAPNVAGYLGAFTGMANTGPGTDPQAIASILSTVNAAIQHGGNAGEASQNFMYRVLGNGKSPVETLIQEEGGMFGSEASTLGEGSPMSKFRAAYHMSPLSLGASSGQTNFSSIMAGMERQYANNPELMLDAMHRTFGTSYSQSATLAAMQKNNPQSVTGAASRLSRLHLDLSKVNATGIERLTSTEANGSLNSEEKDRQFKATYDKNQEKTEGTEIRDGLTGVQKVITDMAEKLVPLTTTIMNSVVYIAGGGKKSQRQIQEANNQAEHDDAVGQIDAVADEKRKTAREAKKEYNAKRFDLESTIKDPRSTPGDRKDAADELSRLRTAADTTAVDADQKNGRIFEDERLAQKNRQTQGRSTPATNPMFLAELAQDDKDLGLTAGTSQAMMMTESSGDASATNDNANGTVDRGLFQINSDLQKDLTSEFVKDHGRTPNPYDPEDSRDLKNMQMKKLLKKFGGDQSKAIRAYHLGAGANLGSAEGDRYMRQIDRNTPSIGNTPLPDDADTRAAAATKAAADRAAAAPANGGSSGPQEFKFTFQHVDQKGKQIPTIKTVFDMPNARAN